MPLTWATMRRSESERLSAEVVRETFTAQCIHVDVIHREGLSESESSEGRYHRRDASADHRTVRGTDQPADRTKGHPLVRTGGQMHGHRERTEHSPDRVSGRSHEKRNVQHPISVMGVKKYMEPLAYALFNQSGRESASCVSRGRRGNNS